MHVQMAPARLGAVRVLLIFQFDRNSDQMPVADAALGNDMLSEMLDIAQRTS